MQQETPQDINSQGLGESRFQVDLWTHGEVEIPSMTANKKYVGIPEPCVTNSNIPGICQELVSGAAYCMGVIRGP